MTTTLFVLQPNGRSARFIAPPSVTRDRRLISDQAETAIKLLRALNVAVCGEPVGPCRQLQVFNHAEAPR